MKKTFFKKIAMTLLPLASFTSVLASCNIAEENKNTTNIPNKYLERIEAIGAKLSELHQSVENKYIFQIDSLKEEDQLSKENDKTVIDDLDNLSVKLETPLKQFILDLPKDVDVSVTKEYENTKLLFKVQITTENREKYVKEYPVEITDFFNVSSAYKEAGGRLDIAKRIIQKMKQSSLLTDFTFTKTQFTNYNITNTEPHTDLGQVGISKVLLDFVNKYDTLVTITKPQNSNEVTWNISDFSKTDTDSVKTTVHGRYADKVKVFPGHKVDLGQEPRNYNINKKDFKTYPVNNSMLFDTKRNAVFVLGGAMVDSKASSPDGRKALIDGFKLNGDRYPGWKTAKVMFEESNVAPVTSGIVTSEGNVWVGGGWVGPRFIGLSKGLTAIAPNQLNTGLDKALIQRIYKDFNDGFFVVGFYKAGISTTHYIASEKTFTKPKSLEISNKTNSHFVQLIHSGDDINAGFHLVVNVITPDGDKLTSRIYKLNKYFRVSQSVDEWFYDEVNYTLTFIAKDRLGRFWTGGSKGEIQLLSNVGKVIDEIKFDDKERVLSIVEDKNDGVFITFTNGHLRHLRFGDEKNKIVVIKDDQVTDNPYLKIYKDNLGYYYLTFSPENRTGGFWERLDPEAFDDVFN